MQRLVPALSLSCSVVAIVLAVSLSRSGAPTPEGGSAAELGELSGAVRELSERIDELERRSHESSTRAAQTGRRTGRATGVPATGSSPTADFAPGSVEEQIAALQARLKELENPEAIARRVRKGRDSMRRKAAASLLEDLANSDLSQEVLRERLFGHWREHGSLVEFLAESGLEESEYLQPLLSLAQDPSNELDMRLEVLGELARSESETLRAPLIDLSVNDQEPELRRQAIRSLAEGHAHDVDVQNAILRSSREDPSDEVRGTAGRRLERLYDVAMETTPGSPVTQLDPSTFPRHDEEELRRFRERREEEEHANGEREERGEQELDQGES